MKIEFILRESTTRDILKPWMDSGRADNSGDGGFVFDNLKRKPFFKDGCVSVETDDAQYIYNVSDFYRIKVSGKF